MDSKGRMPTSSSRNQAVAARRLRLWLTAATILGGATLTESCQIRVRDAVVQGSKNYLATLLDPSVLFTNTQD